MVRKRQLKEKGFTGFFTAHPDLLVCLAVAGSPIFIVFARVTFLMSFLEVGDGEFCVVL